jgi:hypothetical protein
MGTKGIDDCQLPIANRRSRKAINFASAYRVTMCDHIERYLARHDDRAVPAIELAEYALNCGGNRERKRRTVREAVEAMHRRGQRICADCHPTEGGYWMARSDGEWKEYQEARKQQTRYQFVRLAELHRSANELRSGQKTLW